MTRRLRDLFVEPLPAAAAVQPSPADAATRVEPVVVEPPPAHPMAPGRVEDQDRAADATRSPTEQDDRAAQRPLVERTRREASAGRARPYAAVRSVGVLAAPRRAQQATAAVAMALARAGGSRCALVRVVGIAPPGTASSSPLPGARGAAARLRRAGHAAVAVGRLVWVDEAEDAGIGSGEHDRSAGELPRLAEAFGVPAVLGVALPRTAELDRALAAYDGLVLVREPDATDELEPLLLASLAALGPVVASLPAPSRIAGQLAASGMRAPAAALAAVRDLVEASA